MADWRDKILNAKTPRATAQVFKPKTVQQVMRQPEKLKVDKSNPPGTMKRAYKARPAL